MPGSRPAGGEAFEMMTNFYRRKRREVAELVDRTEAATHEAYREMRGFGRDLALLTPSEMKRLRAALVQAPKAGLERRLAAPRHGVPIIVRKEARPQGTPSALRRDGGGGDSVRDVVTKMAIGELAQGVGNAAGFVRGGIHAAEGLVDGAVFVQRLASPVDRILSPPGESAAEQLARATSRSFDLVKKGVADPGAVWRGMRTKAQQMQVDLDPYATPVAESVADEARRRLNVGMNQGEASFEVGSFLVGGPLAKSVKGLGAASKGARAEKYIAQGFSPRAAAHLAEPYPASAMGHHNIARRVRLPAVLGGGPLPRAFSDGPFNRLAPEGISRGDFYELHFKVDPKFHGAGLPVRLRGESWSGKRLGLTKYSKPGRLWHGSPAPLKARVGGTGAAAGGLIDDHSDDGDDYAYPALR